MSTKRYDKQNKQWVHIPTGLEGIIADIRRKVNKLKADDGLEFQFSTDGDGNYGYRGADDSFIPFSLCDMEVLNIFSEQSGSNTTASIFEYEFQKKYKNVLVIIKMNDVDNNGDNYCKVFSEKQSSATFTSFRNTPTDWKSIKINDFIKNGIVVANVNSNYSNDEDKNKTLGYGHGALNATCFQVLSYKKNIKAGDIAYIYVNTYRRCLVTLIGIN